MTDVAATPAPTARPTARRHGRAGGYARTFGGLMLRDLRVLRREFVAFVLRTIMNPLMFVFVFTYVLPKVGQGAVPGPGGAGVNFATVLVPGLVAVAIFFQGISAVALPLAIELSGTREIEDRLMAPVPVPLVALEKIVFSAVQSVVAAIVVFPLVYFVPATPVHVNVSNWALLVGVVLLASLLAGSLGMVVGTSVKPKQIGLIFSLIVIPVTFLGCVYYPWASLDRIRWLQVAVLVNPLVYVSEGLRAALTPQVGHMPVVAFLGAIVVALALLTWLGLRGFTRRVLS